MNSILPENVFEIINRVTHLFIASYKNTILFPTTYMKVNAKLTMLLVATVVFFVSGCRTPVAIDPMTGQQQTGVYQAGFFYAHIEADADTVFRTAIRAIDNMGILRTGETHRNDHINIFARKVGDKKILVRIRQIAPGKSEIRIRVGLIGNLPESQMIFAKIRDAL